MSDSKTTAKALVIFAIREFIQAQDKNPSPPDDHAVKSFIQHSPDYLPLVCAIEAVRPDLMNDLPADMRTLWTWEPSR